MNTQQWEGGFPKGDDLLLVKAAVKKGPEALLCWQEWSSRHVLEDEVTYDHYRMFPKIYENLHELTELPGGLEGAYKKTFFSNNLLLKHLIGVQRALQEQGIPIVVIKGWGMLLSGIYRGLGSRFQFDYDILVPAGQRWQAVDLLENAGYQSVFDGEKPHHLETSHGAGFLSPELPKYNSFDLHWMPIAITKSEASTQLFFREKIEVNFKGERFYTVPPEMLLLHTIVHGLRHENSSNSQWVCDAMTILDRCPGFDWEKMARWAQALKLGFYTKKAIAYLEANLDLQLPDEAKNVVKNIRESHFEPYVFGYFNKEKKGIGDIFFWNLHDRQQLYPQKTLLRHTLFLLKTWRRNRQDLQAWGFLRLVFNRLKHLLGNSVPDYSGKK